jgi:hypothetical protein
MSGPREVEEGFDQGFDEDETPTAKHPGVPGVGGRVIEDVVAADLSCDARVERPSRPPSRRGKKR